MGNRAVIAFGKDQTSIGIYLHWNGGRNSVEAFLDAARILTRPGDACYAQARLVQIIGNFFGGNLSLGLGPLKDLDCDNGDNGVYYVDPKTLTITGRAYMRGEEQTSKDHAERVKCVLNANKMFDDRKAA